MAKNNKENIIFLNKILGVLPLNDFSRNEIKNNKEKIRNKSNKKMLGSIIGAGTSLINTVIDSFNQKRLYEQQQADQRKLQNIQNNNIRLNNLNQLANADMSWAYDKFNSTFKLGGQQKKNNIKFKNRFDK